MKKLIALHVMSMDSFKKTIVNTKAFLRNILPISIILLVEKIRSIPLYFRYVTDKKFGKNNFIENNKNFKGKFNNKRCVIIGNGPSLNKTNLSLLKNEYTFGLNRIYLLFEKMGFQTDFLVSINRFVIEQFADEMVNNDCKKYFNYKYRNQFKNKKNLNFISPSMYDKKYFNNIELGYISYTSSVTFPAIQLAIYLGFSEIILVGFDNNFKNKGSSDSAITSGEDDVDHFSKDYFSKGVVWQLPNYRGLDYNFQFVEKYFKKNDLKIVNCTIGGHLENFSRYDLEYYLKTSKYNSKINEK